MADERAKAEAATKRAKAREETKLGKAASGTSARGGRGGASGKASPRGGKAGRGKKRKADDGSEEYFDEPEEKKAKVDDGEWEAPVMEVQSKLVTGATLRDYQLAGAQWLGQSVPRLGSERGG